LPNVQICGASPVSLLPTSFRLSGEQVDRLRAGAREILAESDDFKRLLRDLGAGSPAKGTFP
jgi:hypothetical protein